MISDVSAQVAAQRELAAARAFFQETLDQLPLRLAVLDEHARILFVNEAWNRDIESIRGPSSIGRGYLAACEAVLGALPEFAHQAAPALAELLDGRRANFQAEVRSGGDGESRFWRVRLTRFLDLDRVRVLAFHEDITELRAARAAAERGERLYRAVFDQSYQATWVLSMEGTVLAANRRAQSIMGCAEDAALGHPAVTAAFPRAEEASRAALGLTLNGATAAEPGQLVVDDLDPMGESRSFEVSVKTAVSEVGEPVLRVLEARDVTDRQRFEAELVSARLAAEAADRAKSSFLARMSHEMRTPLHAVLGFARLQLGEAGLSAGARESFAGIEDAGVRLLTLVDDVLDLARIEAGGMPVTDAPADVGALLEELGRRYRSKASEKGLIFDFVPPERLPSWLLLDEPKLRRALGELLENAVRYTERGSVTLTAAWEPAGRHERLFLEVADTGPGIPREELPRLISPFEAGARGSASGGSGLGLALVRRLVRLMGGKLRVESPPGRGSRFQVELPARVLQGVEPRLRPDAGEDASSVGLDRLSDLPVELRDEMRDAARRADLQTLSRVAERVVTVAPELESALLTAIDNFDYASLLRALDG